MKKLFNLLAMLLFSISATIAQAPVSVTDSMFVGFLRPDGVFVIYDAKGTVNVKDGFALKLETTDLKLSKFLAVTDFYSTLDEARAKLGLPSITSSSKIQDSGKTYDYYDCLNCTDDWRKYCPVEIAETRYKKIESSNFISYQHATHSILNIQDLANKGFEAKCNLKVEGIESGTVYVETIQKMGVIRNDMTGFNQFGNNHPMNRYGVGLNKDCVLKLPKTENLRFTWVNTGNTNIEVWLMHPNNDCVGRLDFRECISPGQIRIYEYNPRLYVCDELKSNMNADYNCNRL